VTETPFIALLKRQAEVPDIRIVDVGANPLGGRKATYQRLLDQGLASLVGFEPDPAAFARLQQVQGPRETFLPLAVGDGATHTLRICAMSGMNSLLAPNLALLGLLHQHPRWAEVRSTQEVATVRLDDVAEVAAMDYLKIDIQGGELMVFDHARAKLANCLVVHTEAMFVPMYEGQPLFAEQELALRAHGLMVHTFKELTGHVLKPFKVNGEDLAPLSQVFWSDVIFVKDLTRLDDLAPDQLLKSAVILHEAYRSIDVAHLFLKAHDARLGTTLAPAYVELITRPG
jgi:FkbM family methyltransferase